MLSSPREKSDIYPSSHPPLHGLHGTDMDIGGEGMRGYYDNIIPKRLLALAKEHDPDAALEHFKDKKGSPIDGFPSLPITEKMRASILKKGFKAYARGGVVARSEDPKIIQKAMMIARGLR